MHADPHYTSAWNTLLCGRKRWILLPPTEDVDTLRQMGVDPSYRTKGPPTQWFSLSLLLFRFRLRSASLSLSLSRSLARSLARLLANSLARARDETGSLPPPETRNLKPEPETRASSA